MGWEDQGRQSHMWFGHGTAPDNGEKPEPNSSIIGKSIADRVLAVAYGAIATLPASFRGRVEAQYQRGTLLHLKEAMTAWIKGTRLDRATFAGRFFERDADDPVVMSLHSAALGAATATSQEEIRDAAAKLADAIRSLGVDQWPRFVAAASERARDSATQAAIERSRQPPGPARDAIRPVYPIETAIGVMGAGVAGGVGAVARAVGGAILRQALPGTAAPTAKGVPETSPPNAPPRKTPEPFPQGQPVRIHEGQQGKHLEGSKNYDPTRSTLTVDPHKLLNRFAGRGDRRGNIPVGQPGSKEVFDTGAEVIGINRSRSGVITPTTRGMIH